jgi:6,7-dimethyl-8-ribityllumazine synthase
MIREFDGVNRPENGPAVSVAHCQFVIVVSRYNLEITEPLKQGALLTLKQNQVPVENVTVLWVPGAWELPLAAEMAIEQLKPDAVVCLGCVIRGETTHDQHINGTVSRELGRIGLDFRIPIGFGLLTCNTWDQAVQRAGGSVGNKGQEATEAVIEQLRLGERLRRLAN